MKDGLSAARVMFVMSVRGRAAAQVFSSARMVGCVLVPALAGLDWYVHDHHALVSS